MVYANPGTPGAIVTFDARYDNYIGGKWIPPVKGQYFENISPVTGEVFCEVARSTAEDIELALDAAHAAKTAWGKTSATERSNILLKIADAVEANLEQLAVAELHGAVVAVGHGFALPAQGAQLRLQLVGRGIGGHLGAVHFLRRSSGGRAQNGSGE